LNPAVHFADRAASRDSTVLQHQPWWPVQRIRILLGRMPRMLRDILYDAITSQTDLAVIEQADDDALCATLSRADPDVVVLELREQGSRQEVAELLRRYPRATVLGVSPDGREAMLYALRPNVDFLYDTSPRGLLDAIRAALSAPTTG
jgi:DNA-binding NarL/FixJ family response regulator